MTIKGVSDVFRLPRLVRSAFGDFWEILPSFYEVLVADHARQLKLWPSCNQIHHYNPTRWRYHND